MTPAPVDTVVGDPGGDGGNGGGGSTTPSPAAVDDGSTPRGGSFTAAPVDVEMTSCKNIRVMIEGTEEFDGVYVMVRKMEMYTPLT